MGLGNDNRQETKTQYQVIVDAIEQILCDVNTALPGIISSYDPNTHLATVQPGLQRKYKDQDAPVDLPLITNVPVAFPKAGQSWLRLPINPGDEGLLVFNQRSIDKWLDQGGTVDPLDNRKFDLSDAVFIPGFTSKGNAIKSKGRNTSAEFANGSGFIEVQPQGAFKI